MIQRSGELWWLTAVIHFVPVLPGGFGLVGQWLFLWWWHAGGVRSIHNYLVPKSPSTGQTRTQRAERGRQESACLLQFSKLWSHSWGEHIKPVLDFGWLSSSTGPTSYPLLSPPVAPFSFPFTSPTRSHSLPSQLPGTKMYVFSAENRFQGSTSLICQQK